MMPLQPVTAPNIEAVHNLLRTVVDPEVGVNIVDLGLVYCIELAPGLVQVEMTMTSQACPMGEMILDDVKATLDKGLPDDWQTEVRLVWEPPWNPAMMNERTRRHFGW